MSTETGVEWVRLQTSIYHKGKLLNLLGMPSGHRTALAYVLSLAYAGANGCVGTIPKAALPLIQATRVDAKRLVDADLWETTKDGWKIHDWDVYQPTPGYVKKLSDAGKAGAAARWANREAKIPEPALTSESPPPF